jgi:hypothetical protein
VAATLHIDALVFGCLPEAGLVHEGKDVEEPLHYEETYGRAWRVGDEQKAIKLDNRQET